MGRLSPGMAGGVWLISSMSRARARATRGSPGGSRATVIAAGVKVITPARPRMMLSRVMARLVMADTALVPYDMGTFGSRTTPTMASQIRRAAATAREALLDLAAEKWNV